MTQWTKVLLEKLTVIHLVKKFLTFYGTQRSITVHKSPALFPTLSQMYPVHTIPLYFPKIHFNITFPDSHGKGSDSISFLYTKYEGNKKFEQTID